MRVSTLAWALRDRIAELDINPLIVREQGQGVVAADALLVLRGVSQTARYDSLFTALVAVGLVSQLGLQAIINMASTLAIIPTKGMTLPFLSYGGSSLLSLAVSMGIFLAVTRRRPRQESFL